MFLFVSRREPAADAVAILMIGAAIYAFLESVRAGIDDNLVGALPTALAVYQMSLVFPPPLLRIVEIAPTHLLAALGVNAAVAALTAALGIVSRSGAVAGGIAGFLILAFGGWASYGVLWAFFLAGTIATKLGYRRKAALGVAQSDTGRRGAAHVVANCLVPAALLLLGVRAVAFVAAFGAALADTLGTEIGTLFGRRPSRRSPFGRSLPERRGRSRFPGTAASLGRRRCARARRESGSA